MKMAGRLPGPMATAAFELVATDAAALDAVSATSEDEAEAASGVLMMVVSDVVEMPTEWTTVIVNVAVVVLVEVTVCSASTS